MPFTRFQAAWRFSGASIRSSRSSLKAGSQRLSPISDSPILRYVVETDAAPPCLDVRSFAVRLRGSAYPFNPAFSALGCLTSFAYLPTTMASADFCPLPTRITPRRALLHASVRERIADRSPRIRTLTFAGPLPHLPRHLNHRTSSCRADSSGAAAFLMRFLFVNPQLCLMLPPDPASRRRPCHRLAILFSGLLAGDLHPIR